MVRKSKKKKSWRRSGKGRFGFPLSCKSDWHRKKIPSSSVRSLSPKSSVCFFVRGPIGDQEGEVGGKQDNKEHTQLFKRCSEKIAMSITAPPLPSLPSGKNLKGRVGDNQDQSLSSSTCAQQHDCSYPYGMKSLETVKRSKKRGIFPFFFLFFFFLEKKKKRSKIRQYGC